MTIVGSIVAIFLGKQAQKQGKRDDDGLIQKHAEYSPQYRRLSQIMKEKNDEWINYIRSLIKISF